MVYKLHPSKVREDRLQEILASLIFSSLLLGCCSLSLIESAFDGDYVGENWGLAFLKIVFIESESFSVFLLDSLSETDRVLF